MFYFGADDEVAFLFVCHAELQDLVKRMLVDELEEFLLVGRVVLPAPLSDFDIEWSAQVLSRIGLLLAQQGPLFLICWHCSFEHLCDAPLQRLIDSLLIILELWRAHAVHIR